ncbi:MAG: prephenate dehydrogenase/arogenate dehydrogenase family protein [Thermodesulfobacteriota bacterium]
MTVHFDKVAIVGVGLIGGSLAMVMREKGLASHIIGIGRGVQNLKDALRLGIVDEYTTDLIAGVKGANLVVLATPVCSTLEITKQISQHLDEGAIITDVGSVKDEIIQAVEHSTPDGLFFVAGHPIAGTENSGAKAAFSTLFKEMRCILTPTEKTDSDALEKIKNLWEQAGSNVIIMSPEDHDRILAVVSHLPHLVAYSLVNSLLGMKDSNDVLKYCAGGFKDFTRIASSSPEMWRDIFLLNKDKILETVSKFQESIEKLKDLIESEDGQGILDELKRAASVRELIK